MWTCPKCGEQIENQFKSCWNCAAKPDAAAPTTSRFERVLIIVVGLCLAIPVIIYLLHAVAYTHFCHRIGDADRVVVTAKGYPGSTTITGEKAVEIVQAIGSAHRDSGSYAASFSFRTSFYHGTKYLGEVSVCSDLFLFEGRQYYTRHDALRTLNVLPSTQGVYDSAERKRAR